MTIIEGEPYKFGRINFVGNKVHANEKLNPYHEFWSCQIIDSDSDNSKSPPQNRYISIENIFSLLKR